MSADIRLGGAAVGTGMGHAERHRRARWFEGVLVCGGAAFVVLAAAAHQAPYLPFDPPVGQAVQSARTSWTDSLAQAISWPGFPPQSDVLVGLLVVAAAIARRWLVAAAIGAVALLTSGAYLVTQQLVGQPRPSTDLIQVAQQLPLSAFPSGHEATFTSIFGFLAFLAFTHARTLTRRGVPLVLLLIGILAIGWARMYEGAHWFSDILAGVLLGCLCLALVVRAYRWILQKRSPRH